LEEREEISRGLAAGLSIRAIADGLNRSPSTVGREVNANGGRTKYRALQRRRWPEKVCRRCRQRKQVPHGSRSTRTASGCNWYDEIVG